MARLAPEVRFVHAAPQLPSADLARTKAWYEKHLGFQSLGDWKQWDFLILDRDGVRLHFYPTQEPELAGAGTFYLRVEGDIDALAARLRAEGLDLHDDPEDKPYGMREFTVHDPDGRHVLVGRPLEAPR